MKICFVKMLFSQAMLSMEQILSLLSNPKYFIYTTNLGQCKVCGHQVDLMVGYK